MGSCPHLLPRWLRRVSRRDAAEHRLVKLVPIGRALALTLAAAITATGLLLAGALAWLGFPDTTGKAPTVAELLDTLKIVLAVVGGIGGVIALVVAYRKQRITEEENHRAREQNERGPSSVGPCHRVTMVEVTATLTATSSHTHTLRRPPTTF